MFPGSAQLQDEGDAAAWGRVQRQQQTAVGTALPSRRPPFLTPERVELRFNTLLDAFDTADRRQRGYLPYERVVEIYSLYFNASVGVLQDDELAAFADKFMSHSPSDGVLVVEYAKLAEELRRRDIDMMNKKDDHRPTTIRVTINGTAKAVAKPQAKKKPVMKARMKSWR